ncbi:S8 family serine peptidase [bacterium SCSIO 12741]|nr:S8 family serine peptidase [bacterium SCSIO 12741]
MKKVLLSVWMLLSTVFVLAQSPDLSLGIRDVLYGAERSDKWVEVWVSFRDKPDFERLRQELSQGNYTPLQRRNKVYRLLQEADKRQTAWFSQLDQKFPGGWELVDDYWISNSAVVRTSPQVLQYLAKSQQVAHVSLSNEWNLTFDEPEQVSPTSKESVNGTEPGLRAVQAPEMWKRGYTGKGRLALIMDTGFWRDHPALKDSWRGNRRPLSETWYGFDSRVPIDKASSHGTHVCGTVLGLDPANNDTIGVAFNAEFIAADHVVSNLNEIKPLHIISRAFEWALDPDGDTNTISDVPDVINNSWGHALDSSEMICTNPIGDAFEALHLAGVAVVFSAGNDGPGAKTIGSPATITRSPYLVFTVGAINGNQPSYPIASFSSRGVSHCADTGKLAIKPEVVAPGVSVRSAVGDDSYAQYQGTSMASPHVSGCVLLLKEAFPNLTGEQLLEALYLTAHDLGDPGEDNTYGNGMIDVDSAFRWLSQIHTPVVPQSYSEDVEVILSEYPDRDSIYCDHYIDYRIQIVNHGARPLDKDEYEMRLEITGQMAPFGPKQDIMPGDTFEYHFAFAFNFQGSTPTQFLADVVILDTTRSDDPENNSVGHYFSILPPSYNPWINKIGG